MLTKCARAGGRGRRSAGRGGLLGTLGRCRPGSKGCHSSG